MLEDSAMSEEDSAFAKELEERVAELDEDVSSFLPSDEELGDMELLDSGFVSSVSNRVHLPSEQMSVDFSLSTNALSPSSFSVQVKRSSTVATESMIE